MAPHGGGTRLERLLRLLEGAYGRPPRALRRSREAAARLAEWGAGWRLRSGHDGAHAADGRGADCRTRGSPSNTAT
jgi:hypothetical protein